MCPTFWRQVISLSLTFKIEPTKNLKQHMWIFKKEKVVYFSPFFWIEINDSPFVSMSTQQSERVSHDRAVSFSSRGLSYSYTQRYYYYVRTEKEKKTCHVGKYLYYLFLFECAKGKCVRRLITFMCQQQLSFVVSFLSWVNEKKQQLTGAIHACKCRQSYLIFNRNKRLK